MINNIVLVKLVFIWLKVSKISKVTEFNHYHVHLGLPWWLSGKEPACNAKDVRDAGLVPGLGRSPGDGNGNLPQYSAWRILWTVSLAGYGLEGHKESDTSKAT